MASQARVRRPGEPWHELGVVKGFESDADPWGAKSASFAVPLDCQHLFRKNDEVEVDVQGSRSWTGRVKTPAAPGGSVSLEGWQFHLDDDIVNTVFVHDRLSDWRDMRGFPLAGLWRVGTSAGQVEVGDGSIMLAWPKGTEASSQAPTVGVVLDLGPSPSCWIKKVQMTYSKEAFTTGTGQFLLLVRSASDEGVWDIIDGFEDGVSHDPATGFPAPFIEFATATFGTPRRYVAIILTYQGASTLPFSGDQILKLLSVRCFRESAYESGGVSQLRVSDVIKDLRDRGTTKIGKSDLLIPQTSVFLPHFMTEGPSTVREGMRRAAAFEFLQPRVSLDSNLGLHVPSDTPSFKTQHGSKFEPATGEAEVNKLTISAIAPDGTPQEYTYHSAELDGARLREVSSPSFPNPSFDAGVSGWTAWRSGVLEIWQETDPSRYLTAPGCALVTVPGDYIKVGDYVETELLGTHEAGTMYVAEIHIRRDARQVWRLWYGRLDVASNRWVDASSTIFIHDGPSDSYNRARVAWLPHDDYSDDVFFRVESMPSLYDPYVRTTVGDYYLDEANLYQSLATDLDVQGIERAAFLDVRSAMPLDQLELLARAYLQARGRDRIAGSLTIPRGSLIRLPDGDIVEPDVLQQHVGELIHIHSEVDPLTGNPGRNGRIASATYDDTEEVAIVSIDERIDVLEQLLDQMGASGS